MPHLGLKSMPAHHFGLVMIGSRAHKGSMAETRHRACKCGAVYNRSEAMAASREIGSFECGLCGTTMETWNTAWVPAYRLVAGPV